MGLQFFIIEVSPFLGINLIRAVLKLSVSLPFMIHTLVYSKRGCLKCCQNFLIKRLFKPSIPGAELVLQRLKALSSSSTATGLSSLSLSSPDSIQPRIAGWFTNSPKKFSTKFSKLLGIPVDFYTESHRTW
jgi:hypothetical protein